VVVRILRTAISVLAVAVVVVVALKLSSPQMNDSEALQGLWRIQSSTSQGRPVYESATHYLITGNSMKEIVPDFVDDGKLRTTFVLDESASPKRLTETLDYNGPVGPPDPNPIVLKYLYRIDGDTLVLCSGTFGLFPDEISDEYSIKTLVRDHGPVPEPKEPSGTPPLVDDLLGSLEWDDNLNWYRGEVRVANASFDLSLNPGEGTDASGALSRARQIVEDFERYRKMAADYAVDGLLELKNDTWLEEGEEEISADEFKAKMKLEAITVQADGGVTFWHHDGDLFWGHSIQVCIDTNDKCTSTDIPG
jgi:uncharacterized protein (TIGR03067 family)